MAKWFRSWHGAPTHRLWRTIARRSKQPVERVALTAWALMDRASRADPRGHVGGFDPELLADFIDCEPEDIQAIYEAFKAKGWITPDDDLANWDEHQQPTDGSDATQAERKRRQRQKQRAQRDQHADNDAGDGHDGAHDSGPSPRDDDDCHGTSHRDGVTVTAPRARATDPDPDTETEVVGVGDACARESSHTEGERTAATIAAECREIIGVDQAWPGFMDHAEPAKWLANGADPDLDIYPTIRRLMAQRGHDPPRKWSYFRQAVADAIAARNKPMPEGNPDVASSATGNQQRDRPRATRPANPLLAAATGGEG